MLGNKVWEGTGRTTGNRVLPGDDFRYVKLEISFEGMGKMLGMDASNMGTLTAFERVAGQMYAQGQGILMTTDGQSAIWNGQGVGHPTGDGMGISFRYAVAFQADPGGPLAALNGSLFVGEYESAADGTWTDALWEWT